MIRPRVPGLSQLGFVAWEPRTFGSFVLAALLAGMVANRAVAQSFGLDDLPIAPLVGPPGPLGGLGAEDPYGFAGPPLAPSPSLFFIGPLGDGAWLSPGPIVQHPGPNGFYIDAFSSNHVDNGFDIELDFSVDRVTIGQPGTGVGAQSGLGQAHGDIFTGTQRYVSPGVFAGTLVGVPFAGFLPSFAAGAPGNVLTTDESVFGLVTPLGVVGPGVPVGSPLLAPALNDNVDSYDNIVSFDSNGDGLFDVDTYFTLYPDEAVAVGLSPSDIIVVAIGDAGAISVAYAPVPLMGLDPAQDSIDALVMFDHNLKPVPIGAGGPGFIEPVTDYALFSLAPGSISLQFFGLDAGDILFTDFTGAFAVYAQTQSLGLIPAPPGIPFAGDNVDALDSVALPNIGQFTIRDGGCQYDLFGLIGQRLTGSGGVANLFTGVNDHLFQNWFWYRGSGDTREYSLSNQIFGSAFNNRARLVYNEPLADGNILNALIFDLEYTISDLSTVGIAGVVGGAAPPACVRCEIVIAIKVRNLTPNSVVVDFFSYNDMDLNNNGAGDSAVIAGIDNHIQLISDPPPGGTNCIASGVYKVSSTDHVAWEIDNFPTIRNRLVDAVADVLTNAVSPFGPGDYTGGQQWKITLGPAGSVLAPPFDEWVGSVVKEIIIHAPGDVNGDCVVNLQDLAFLLSNFGLICTP